MIALPDVITISIDPYLRLGPVAIAWHGLTIALGIAVGAAIAIGRLKQQGEDSDPVWVAAVLTVIGALVGGRLFYLFEHGGPLFGTTGFTFFGGMIGAVALIGLYTWRARLGGVFLDALALGLPLGVAIGRVGDIINGEHYGPASDFFLAVRNAHPDALTPNPALAYHNGGLYESLIGLAIFVIAWLVKDRLPRAGDLTWLVLALFAFARFFEFFIRADSPDLALGLDNTQWTSLGLFIVIAAGWAVSTRWRKRRDSNAQ